MTAHLTLAGNNPSPVGQWAQVLYDDHAGRPRKSRELLQLIPTEGDVGRWKRVVKLLITGDWRRPGDLAEASLAEVIAYFRALKCTGEPDCQIPNLRLDVDMGSFAN